jgi:hypothetical protein
MCRNWKANNLWTEILFCMGRDSPVGIATCYGLDGLGIESRRGKDFLHRSRPGLGPIQPPVQWQLGGQAAGAWR